MKFEAICPNDENEFNGTEVMRNSRKTKIEAYPLKYGRLLVDISSGYSIMSISNYTSLEKIQFPQYNKLEYYFKY